MMASSADVFIENVITKLCVTGLMAEPNVSICPPSNCPEFCPCAACAESPFARPPSPPAPADAEPELTPDEIEAALRQRWGIAACRAQARHRLRRLIWGGARGRDRRPDGGAGGEADGDALAAGAAQHFQAPHAQGGGGGAR